jgi:hypothetical protein
MAAPGQATLACRRVAQSINLLLGRAAFETAMRLYPKDRIEYRKGAQVIERSGGEEG